MLLYYEFLSPTLVSLDIKDFVSGDEQLFCSIHLCSNKKCLSVTIHVMVKCLIVCLHMIVVSSRTTMFFTHYAESKLPLLVFPEGASTNGKSGLLKYRFVFT